MIKNTITAMSDQQWMETMACEVTMKTGDEFPKVQETLTRIGIPSLDGKDLYQSCHILLKANKYFIVHFKELFLLDGKDIVWSQDEVDRRNLIASFLYKWGMIDMAPEIKRRCFDPDNGAIIKIVKHSEKGEWNLKQNYNMSERR